MARSVAFIFLLALFSLIHHPLTAEGGFFSSRNLALRECYLIREETITF